MPTPNILRRVILNAFRGTGTIRNRPRTRPLSSPLEILEARTVPATITVNSILTKLNPGVTVENATTNDYTLINNAIQAAVPGDTIILNGTFDWNKPIAKAFWTLGSDGLASFPVSYKVGNVTTTIPGTGDTEDDNDNYSIFVQPDVDNITLTAAAPVNGKYSAIVKKATTDTATVEGEAFLYFDGTGSNQGWTISNLEIDYFDEAIGMYFDPAGPIDAYSNTTITNNKINVPKDVKGDDDFEGNVGIYVGPGTNQTISNNYILLDGGGISDLVIPDYAQSVGIQTQAAGGSSYDGLLITGNRIEVQKANNAKPEIVIGVWENGNAHSSDITISNNTFTNKATPKPTTSFERAFRITSHSSATTTVSYEYNTVVGANIGFQWLPFVPGDPDFQANFSGLQPVQLIGNAITNTQTGVLVQSNGVVELAENTIANGGANSVGVNMVTGSLTGATQNIITGNVNGILLGAGAGTIGAINNNGIYGNTTFNINNGTASAIDATGNWWGSTAGPTLINNSGAGSVDSSGFLTNATEIFPATEFDFQKATTSPVQGKSIPAYATTAYNATVGYGWLSAPTGFDQTAAQAAALAGNSLASQLRDGAISTIDGPTGAKIFRIDFPDADPRQITAFLGDGSKAYPTVEALFSTDGVNFTSFGTANILVKTYASVTSPSITPTNGTNSIFVQFRDTLIDKKKGWAVAGFNVVRVADVAPLTVTPPGGTLPSDAVSTDVFTVSGATPGALLTVATDFGKLVTPDASSAIAGSQIVADSNGDATFQIARPFLAGTANITVTDFAGLSAPGATTQAYSFPTTGTRKFDMNIATVGKETLPDATWLDVKSTRLFSTAGDYGWATTGISSKDLATNFPAGSDQADQNMYRDYNFSTSTAIRSFQVFVGAGQSASVKVYAFSTTASHSPVGMIVGATGGTPETLTSGNNFVTVTGTAGADGILVITFSKGLTVATGNKAWVVNGMEVTLI